MSSIKESPAPCMFPRALADRVENQAKEALEKFELGDKSDAETGQFALDEEVKSGENGSLTKSAIARENPIIITPLSFVPHKRIKKYVGRINLHFIRESWSVVDLGEFYHDFFLQIYECCRAQVSANGGNALLSFKINPRVWGKTVQKPNLQFSECKWRCSDPRMSLRSVFLEL